MFNQIKTLYESFEFQKLIKFWIEPFSRIGARFYATWQRKTSAKHDINFVSSISRSQTSGLYSQLFLVVCSLPKAKESTLCTIQGKLLHLLVRKKNRNNQYKTTILFQL